MAHYAFLDLNNVVTQVIVGKDENNAVEGVTDWESYYGELMGQTCKRTSYNTNGGVHSGGGVAYRGNYAGIGYSFDEALDAFITKKPYPSWTLNTETFTWDSPVAYPEDEGYYNWDESAQQWVEEGS
jgi:hypothetical protein